MSHPHHDDVVVRKTSGNPSVAYLLGTPAHPDQFIVHTRDAAVAQAVAYAKHQYVRAWFANGNDDFVLLGMFQPDVEPARGIVVATS